MKLIEYKKPQFDENDDLELVGEINMSNVKLSRAYEGEMDLIEEMDSGADIILVKKKDIEEFENGSNTINLYFLRTKGNNDRAFSQGHCIGDHVNSLFVGEIKNLLNDYSDDEYVILWLTDYGQFFEYTDYKEGTDYTIRRSFNENGQSLKKVTFFVPNLKDRFTWELKATTPIRDLMDEIGSLKVSEDVFFVEHGTNIGYAAYNMDKLRSISGYIYKNYLIKE